MLVLPVNQGDLEKKEADVEDLNSSIFIEHCPFRMMQSRMEYFIGWTEGQGTGGQRKRVSTGCRRT